MIVYVPTTTEIYTLSLHDALPIWLWLDASRTELLSTELIIGGRVFLRLGTAMGSEVHTSELQSHSDLVCRLLLENKILNIDIQYHNQNHHT